MKQSLAEIRILSDGMMNCQNQFLNIYTDIPSKERKEMGDKNPLFQTHQSDFNSAERTNRERREKYQVLSYALDELCYKYSTKDFLYLKYNEIIQVSAYCIKVLDMLLDINKVFYTVEKEKENYKSRHRNSKTIKIDQLFYNSLAAIQKYLSLLSDIKVSISTLTSCSQNINVNRAFEQLIYDFRINLELIYVPQELLPVINLILPGVNINRIDTNKIKDEGYRKEVLSFIDFEKQFHNLIKRFRDQLINQFSYYVTSADFLNNPIKKTIFVVDPSIYRKLNFPASGLYRNEIFDMEKSACGSDVYVKLGDFYNDLLDFFTKAILESKEQLEALITYDEHSALQNYIDIYEMATKNKTGCSISKVKKQLSNPRYHEALNNMLIHTRLSMYEVLETVELDRIKDASIQAKLPWNKAYSTNPQFDIDTLHYLYDIQQRCFYNSGVPFTACMRLFNLFSYCANPQNRGPRHIKTFQAMKEEDFPDSYCMDFKCILMI